MGRKSAVYKDGTARPYLGTHPEDMPIMGPSREVWCVHYADCLDRAVIEKLSTWSCQDCDRVERRKYLTTIATSWPCGEDLGMAVLPSGFLD